ncbi:MAG: hypothetical protein JOY84_21435 [Curvibacter sp.]|nr:hypothetical protein [Curvibacter sp.]
MQYPNGDLIQVGDEVLIERKTFGRVIASMDTSAYLPGEESWDYLNEGVMIQTDFAGLVHYTTDASDLLELRRRPSKETPPTV